MAQEDLALSLRSIRVCGGIGFSKLEVGFYVNLRALRQVAQVVVRTRVERQNGVPGCLALAAR